MKPVVHPVVKPVIHTLAVCAMLCFVLSGSAVEAKMNKKLKFCKLDMLVECGIEPNTMFTSTQNGSGIVNSQAEMEQFCFNQIDYFPVCARQWLDRCASPTHKDVIDRMFITPMGEAMKVFCAKEGHIRDEFLKYSNCLIFDVKLSPDYRRECIRPLQAAGEFIHERAMATKKPDLLDFLKNTCCAFNKWEGCILRHLTERCGKPSADVFPYLIHQGSLDLLRYLCKPLKYDPEDPKKCDKSKYIAPESLKPKGLSSPSLISYIFSYSCPNVGWGIVPERDW